MRSSVPVSDYYRSSGGIVNPSSSSASEWNSNATPYSQLDPIDHSHSSEEDDKAKNSLFSSVFSLVCTTVGAGVLAIPSGMVPIGWMGLLLLFIVSFTCVITANYLIECQFAFPGHPFKTYEEIGEAAIPRYGKPLVTIVQLITLIGVPAIFLILIGSNMHSLIPQLTQHVWAFIFAAVLIPIAWIKTMKEISILAYFGVFASFFVALFVVIRGIQILINGDIMSDIPGFPSGTEIKFSHSTDVFIPSGLAEAINIMVFGFGGQSVIPNIVSELRDPQRQFRRFTLFSYSIIGIVYGLVAGFGYAAWGDSCQSNILDSINGVLNNVSIGHPPYIVYVFGQISRAIIVVHLITAYPILLNPVSLYFEDLFKLNTSTHQVSENSLKSRRFMLRTGLVLITLALASTVPYFGDILQLVSSLSLVVVAFIFPPIFYYLLFKPVRTFPYWEKFVMLLILIGGIASSVIGCYYAIKDLIHDIENKPPFDNYFTN